MKNTVIKEFPTLFAHRLPMLTCLSILKGCVCVKDSLPRLQREAHPAMALQLSSGLRQLRLAVLPSVGLRWDWTMYPRK